jgi:hypothetical protein
MRDILVGCPAAVQEPKPLAFLEGDIRDVGEHPVRREHIRRRIQGLQDGWAQLFDTLPRRGQVRTAQVGIGGMRAIQEGAQLHGAMLEVPHQRQPFLLHVIRDDAAQFVDGLVDLRAPQIPLAGEVLDDLLAELALAGSAFGALDLSQCRIALGLQFAHLPGAIPEKRFQCAQACAKSYGFLRFAGLWRGCMRGFGLECGVFCEKALQLGAKVFRTIACFFPWDGACEQSALLRFWLFE